MASVQSRSGRRKAMAEINMIPFIDVMLVLLIILMVSAPLITVGVVDLPSVGQSAQRPVKVVEVVIDREAAVRLRVDGREGPRLAVADVVARVRDEQAGDATVPVVISADKEVKYEVVMQVMDRLQRAGVQRVGLSVRQASSS